MQLPDSFLEATREDLRPLAATRGTACLSIARRAVGRAGRIAQIVPEAAPFAASLWAALAASEQQDKSGRRSAPPGRVACTRFARAAHWFVQLLSHKLFPLQRVVLPNADASVAVGDEIMEFDASPWGGGAVLHRGGQPVAWTAVRWETHTLAMFGAATGDCAHQSLFEFLMLLMGMLAFARDDAKTALVVQGDNLGALNDALRLRSSSPKLNAIARELAFHKATRRWSYVLRHLPADRNVLADALSRLHAVPPLAMPVRLGNVPCVSAPVQDDSLWQCWMPLHR